MLYHWARLRLASHYTLSKTTEDHLIAYRYAGIVAAAVLGAALAGCATTNKQASAQPDEEKTYVTGSRLPARNGGASGTKVISDKSEINKMMTKGGNATGGVTGNAGN